MKLSESMGSKTPNWDEKQAVDQIHNLVIRHKALLHLAFNELIKPAQVSAGYRHRVRGFGQF